MDRLHDRQAEALLHGGNALRRLAAVQLQHVGLQHLDDGGEQNIVGIDRERHLAGPALDPPAERARGQAVEVARRRRKEHEADEIGPRLERDLERFRRLQAADFYEDGHCYVRRFIIRCNAALSAGNSRDATS